MTDWLFAAGVAATPVVVFGALAAFPRTRKFALWILTAFLFLLGWSSGLIIAMPDPTGDKGLAVAFARFIVLGLCVCVSGMFALVGGGLTFVRATRPLGKRILLAMLTFPIGVGAGFGISRFVIPEWREGVSLFTGPGASRLVHDAGAPCPGTRRTHLRSAPGRDEACSQLERGGGRVDRVLGAP